MSIILGLNTKIDKSVEFRSNADYIIGDNTEIRRGTVLDVSEFFEIGKDSIIGEDNIIKGRNIKLGREFYSNHHAEIGGGSCYEESSSLKIGYWFHMGSYSHINTAMPVTIGNQVGLGRFTNIYTHGAYLSMLNGFPVEFGSVKIGNNVWIPQATVLPNVTIGDYVVIAAGSLVNKNVPSFCLAGGVPCKVIREKAFPLPYSYRERTDLIKKINKQWNLGLTYFPNFDHFQSNSGHDDFVIFEIDAMTIIGNVSAQSERARNILRRHGIRFKVEVNEKGEYQPWAEP